MLIKHWLFAQRNLGSYLKKSWLYTCLGLLSVSFIIIFQDSIDRKIKKDGQSLLSGDIEFEIRGKLEKPIEDYLSPIESEIESFQEVIDLNGMIRSKEASLLISANGVGKEYPYYNPKLRSFFNKALKKENAVVLSQEASDRLKLQIGDTIFFGQKELQVSDILKPENLSFNFSAFLPNIYINHKTINETGLIGPMSSEEREFLIKLKNPENINAIESRLRDSIQDSSIEIKTYTQNNDRSSRILERLNQFISIIAMICLIYAFIGCLYSFRQYLLENIPNILIWKSLGYSYNHISKIWHLKIVEISLILFISIFILQKIGIYVISEYTNLLNTLDVRLSFYSLVFTFVLCLLFHLVVYYTYSSNLKEVKGLSLLRGGVLDSKLKLNKWVLGLAFIGFYFVSFHLSNSFLITNLFVGGLVLSLLGLWLFFQLFLIILARLQKYFTFKYIYHVFLRNQITFLAIFFSLTIGITISQLIPFLSLNIQKQLNVDGKPSLFFFDIQEDQVENFQAYLKKNYNLKLTHLSPMVRARLNSINGEEVLDSSFLDIESEDKRRKERFRNRAFNLSYRDELSDSETIIEGSDLANYSGPHIPVSLEKRFSTRTDIGIGDILSFDIFGQEIVAEVYNIRSINWFSFQPNFFVQFGDGILNGFPKTYLATIRSISNEEKRELQYEINNKFNNIASVDLDLIINRVLQLLKDFQGILNLLSRFSLLIGFLVFFAIYGHFIQSRENEIRNLKILGATKAVSRKIFFTEMLLLFTFCSLFGLLCSVLMSSYIIESIFLFPWSFIWQDSLNIVAFYFVFMLLTFLYYHQKFFNKSSADLLRN